MYKAKGFPELGVPITRFIVFRGSIFESPYLGKPPIGFRAEGSWLRV